MLDFTQRLFVFVIRRKNCQILVYTIDCSGYWTVYRTFKDKSVLLWLVDWPCTSKNVLFLLWIIKETLKLNNLTTTQSCGIFPLYVLNRKKTCRDRVINRLFLLLFYWLAFSIVRIWCHFLPLTLSLFEGREDFEQNSFSYMLRSSVDQYQSAMYPAKINSIN